MPAMEGRSKNSPHGWPHEPSRLFEKSYDHMALEHLVMFRVDLLQTVRSGS